MPFVCAHATHVVETVRMLVHSTRIEAQKCVVAGIVSKSSAYDATLKIQVIFILLHGAQRDQYWNGTNSQLRPTRRVFSTAYDINLFLMDITPA